MSGKLPSLTTSTRVVHNKESGLDLYVQAEQQSVPSKRLSKATLYNITVVSNLSNFSATEGNTSHYALEKSHDDLLRLQNKLSKRFSGTLIPDVPKKPISLIDNPAKARERLKQCDNFLQFCAKTSKIVKSEELLQFLAINDIAEIGKALTEDIDPPKNDGRVQPKDQSIAKVKLFEDVIAATEEQIFEDDDGDEELPAYIHPTSTRGKNLNITQPSAQLYKEASAPVLKRVKTQSNSQIDIEEQVTASDESNEDEIANLMRRLHDARLNRDKREEKRSAREYEVNPSSDDNCSNNRDTTGPEVGEMGLDDISKYIDENSSSTHDLNLDL